MIGKNVKKLFRYFLQSRHITRHFRRLVVLSTLPKRVIPHEIPPAIAQGLKSASLTTSEELLSKFASSVNGITEESATRIRQTSGLNEVNYEKPLPWPKHLWLSYQNPFNILLTTLAAISFFTGDTNGALVILIMVIFSTLLRFWQEVKANKAADALKAMVSNTIAVIRPPLGGAEDPQEVEIPIKELVPGDVIHVSAGDMVPADCRVLSTKTLFVSQGSMTGESMPVEKFSAIPSIENTTILDLNNILFMQTNVVTGSAKVLVIATGNQTYFGSLATHIVAEEQEPTAFQTGINKVSWLLIRFMFIMVPIVFFINGFTKGTWGDSLLFALSVAVGLTPEMLPMIATATLAKGAVFLSRKKVIVKRLDAIQNFGAMDTLCTDKTGTLTQDSIVLSNHYDPWGSVSDDVLKMAYLNSYYQTGLKNLLDIAVLKHSELRRIQHTDKQHKVDEIPFDFNRRRMSVVVTDENNKNLIITKGAVEEILSVSSHVIRDGVPVPLTENLLNDVRSVTQNLNTQGLRVVAVAVKEAPLEQKIFGVTDEQNETLVGYIAFLDPPKDSAAEAIQTLYEHGISIKVLTGDNTLVTKKICQEVGIPLGEGSLLTGPELDAMDDESLKSAIETAIVYTKLTPDHKARIVRLLRENGHVTGFMGDGINDAPALRTADIGISVDSGADIAKEASDIVLLEKSLKVLGEGVREGRRTFANMMKYIRMAASSNFGNVFSILIAGAFLPFLPMLPIHLLMQNLLYDVSQTAIPFDNVDEELLQKPQKWHPADIGRFMVCFGPLSSLFDITTFLIMWYIFKANSEAHQTLFQSGWFIEGLLTQTLIVYMIRSPKVTLLRSKVALPLVIMTIGVASIGVFIPLGPLAPYFKLQALPPVYFVYLTIIILGYTLLTQFVKIFYVRRFGW